MSKNKKLHAFFFFIDSLLVYIHKGYDEGTVLELARPNMTVLMMTNGVYNFKIPSTNFICSCIDKAECILLLIELENWIL